MKTSGIFIVSPHVCSHFRIVWVEDCRSWHKAGTTNGRVTALWSGSTLHYREAIKGPQFEDWQFSYYNNPFEWIGNFMSSSEKRNGDASWYIKQLDDSVIDPCLKKTIVKNEVVQKVKREDISALEAIANLWFWTSFENSFGITFQYWCFRICNKCFLRLNNCSRPVDPPFLLHH